MTRRRLAVAAVPLAVGLVLGGCSGDSTTSTSTAGSDTASSSAPQPSATGGPPSPPSSGGASGSAFVEIVRTGGIAGVRDVVRVAADGTAKLLTRDGRTRSCRPSADAVAKLRAMDLQTVAAQASASTTVNDGFTFTVRTPQGSASAGDGNADGRRAELLSAAAAVVSACLAGVPATGGPVVR